VNSRIAEERSLLGQQALQQRIVFHVGIQDQANQLSAMAQLAVIDMITHTRGEEPLAGFIKEDSRTRFNQAAYFAQLMFADLRHSSLPSQPLYLPIRAALAAPTNSGRCSLVAGALLTRNCDSASFNCSDMCTSCSTVREVWRAPCD